MTTFTNNTLFALLGPKRRAEPDTTVYLPDEAAREREAIREAAKQVPAILPVVPASQALQANLQRAVDAYTSRADTLTKEIETRQGEHADVMRARDAAVLALEALLGDVSVAAVEADLFDDSRVGSAGFSVEGGKA